MDAKAEHPGVHLKRHRIAKGWTQEDLGFILGGRRAAVCRIERGRSGITPATAKQLAAAFGNDPMYWMRLWGDYRLSRVKPRRPETAEEQTQRVSNHQPWNADMPYEISGAPS